MNRRAFLVSIGGGGMTATAGCLEYIEERLDRQPKRQFKLGWLSAANTDTKSHRFDLQVENGGTIVHQSSHHLQGQNEKGPKGEPQIAAAKCTWGDVADDYIIRARVDGNDWIAKPINAVELNGRPDTDCVVAQARYRDNTLEIVLQPGCDGVDRWDGGCPFANE